MGRPSWVSPCQGAVCTEPVTTVLEAVGKFLPMLYEQSKRTGIFPDLDGAPALSHEASHIPFDHSRLIVMQ